ncbi:hypothetical protein BJ165DRAFT_1523202 [Panaeolus papilionaceus]|nr:hypothetical protein BJ165DRAFT_1523202 [Panaeolus papilionaceus]
MRQALRQASMEKDQLLRAQTLEHDGIIQDHKAEADGDRAVLDRQFSEFPYSKAIFAFPSLIVLRAGASPSPQRHLATEVPSKSFQN